MLNLHRLPAETSRFAVKEILGMLRSVKTWKTGGLISIRQSRLILVYSGSFVKLNRIWEVFSVFLRLWGGVCGVFLEGEGDLI